MAIQGLVQIPAWDETRRDTLLRAAADMAPELKRQIQTQIASQWAMMDPEGALAWAVALPEDERAETLLAASGPLLTTDPRRGGEILLEHASPEERPDVYANVVSQWAHRDPNAAGEWLGEQTQGPELDQARLRFSSAVVRRDPESAMAWAMTVEDADLRVDAIRNTWRQWSQSDPEAAGKALENAGLSEEQLQAIRPAESPQESGSR